MRALLLMLALSCAPQGPMADPCKSPAPKPSSIAPSVLAEARLLARVRAAMEAADLDEAWDAVLDHESRFPEGELAPDREVFAVAVLVQRGEHDEARWRAEDFLENHDECAHGQRMRALLRGVAAF